MPINPNGIVIKDTITNLYLISYNINLEHCGWGNVNTAIDFETQENANEAIVSWGEDPGARYVGVNPPSPR